MIQVHQLNKMGHLRDDLCLVSISYVLMFEVDPIQRCTMEPLASRLDLDTPSSEIFGRLSWGEGWRRCDSRWRKTSTFFTVQGFQPLSNGLFQEEFKDQWWSFGDTWVIWVNGSKNDWSHSMLPKLDVLLKGGFMIEFGFTLGSLLIQFYV